MAKRFGKYRTILAVSLVSVSVLFLLGCDSRSLLGLAPVKIFEIPFSIADTVTKVLSVDFRNAVENHSNTLYRPYMLVLDSKNMEQDSDNYSAYEYQRLKNHVSPFNGLVLLSWTWSDGEKETFYSSVFSLDYGRAIDITDFWLKEIHREPVMMTIRVVTPDSELAQRIGPTTLRLELGRRKWIKNYPFLVE